VVLVALAPALVSGIAKGAIENGGSDAIAGRVTVDSVSLSWTGPQRVKSLRVLTPSDERVARVDVEMTAGLFGLVFGSRDLGEVRVSGEAEIVRDATGVSNLDRAISGEPRAPSAGASAPRSAARRSGPLFTVPEGFAADLELGGLTVLYRDASLEAASSGRVLAGGVRDLRGAVRVAAGEATTADLRGVLFVARQGASGLTDRGSVRVVMGADGLIGANGNASLDRATLAVEITADALGTEALFALTGGAIPALWAEPGLVDRAIGPTVRLSLAGEGTAERFLINTKVEAEHIAINAPALLLGRTVIEARQPVTVRLGLDRLALLNPGSTAALSGSGGVEIGALPEARLTVSSLNWPTPAEGPGSVRRLAFNGAIALGEIAGRLGGDDAEARPFRIPASTLTASSSGLASGASVAWSTPVEIDGASSGSVAIDLSANEVLDAAGGFAPARALATLSGRATLDNLPTAVASSLASAFGAGDVLEGVNLPQALGPRLRASLEAQPAASGTSITLALAGEHADIAARLISDGSVLSAALSGEGSPVRVELRRPGALGLRGKAADHANVHVPVIRVAKRHRDRRRERNARLQHQRRATREHVGALLRAHALIAPPEAFARHQHEIDLVRPRLNRPAHAGFVQGQRDVARRLRPVEACKHGRGVGHLRHGLGADEAARFHPLDACCFQPRNEFQLLIDAQIGRIILQPVARAHFDDVDTPPHAQLPVKAGARRSTKLATPSLKSCVAKLASISASAMARDCA
jgi:hypothetical protein